MNVLCPRCMKPLNETEPGKFVCGCGFRVQMHPDCYQETVKITYKEAEG